MSVRPRLLVLSGGHPYDETAFEALLGRLGQALRWSVDHRVHPEAEAAVAEGAAEGAAAILFYDMGGYTFGEGRADVRSPSEGYKAAIRAHFARGGGAVAMHHALAGWAAWPEWSEMLGGRFLYAPGEVRGRQVLDSGYRHDVNYEADVLADHPVTAELPPRFPLCDELYLAEVIESEVTPLLSARHSFVAANFYSAAAAVAGRMFDNAYWPHPPGSALIGWTKPVDAGRLVYLQPGDGPAAYNSSNLQRLLANALAWVGA